MSVITRGRVEVSRTATAESLPTARPGAVGNVILFPEQYPSAGERASKRIRGRAYRMRRLLSVSDAVAILAALAVCAVLDSVTRFDASLDGAAVAYLPLFALTWLGLAGIAGLYHLDESRIECSIADEMFRVTQLAAVWIWGVFLVAALAGEGSPAVAPALSLGIVAIPLILAMRAGTRRLARTREWYGERAVVVGAQADRERVECTLGRHPEFGVSVRASIDLDLTSMNGNSEGDRSARLFSEVLAADADRVIFASSHVGIDERSGLLRRLSELGIKVDLVPGDKEILRSDAQVHHIEGLPLLTLPSTRRPRSAEAIKRVMDVALAAAALTVLSPFLLGFAAWIKLESSGPVFFRQRRVGRKGRSFEVLKFRTMVAEAESIKHTVDQLNTRTDGMFKVKDDPRITRAGKFLRRHSFDELPQLLNVLRGEMSLVGPRPLIEAESDRVADSYRARFAVRPGITGPWQVLGRSDIPFEDMVKLDYTYVTNWSIGDDAKLMVRTLSAIGGGRGAY